MTTDDTRAFLTEVLDAWSQADDPAPFVAALAEGPGVDGHRHLADRWHLPRPWLESTFCIRLASRPSVTVGGSARQRA